MTTSLGFDDIKAIRQALNLESLHVQLAICSSPNRIQLRQQIINYLIDNKISCDENQILDLTRLPTIEGGDVSISHCPTIQGFAIALQKCSLGFDLEIESRVSEKIVNRISHPNELRSMPSPAHLWAAKEAAFKVLSKTLKAQVQSEIRISQWVPISNDIYISTASYQNTRISGCTSHINDCFYSIFKS